MEVIIRKAAYKTRELSCSYLKLLTHWAKAEHHMQIAPHLHDMLHEKGMFEDGADWDKIDSILLGPFCRLCKQHDRPTYRYEQQNFDRQCKPTTMPLPWCWHTLSMK